MPVNDEGSQTEGDQISTPLLDAIRSPRDLKDLTNEELTSLADEIRQTIIHVASMNEGHLAPHLGVVELTVALHHVFETDHDLLVWDVGHQTYAHKLLTGRRDRIHTIRKKGGLSGYPKISESPYDAFGVGHSSTSISAALGMAVARDRMKIDRRIVAIIGDGAITAGMAWEAMAHAGHLGTDLIVVLNDNRMSISPNVGSISSYFNRLITHGIYNRAKGDIGHLLERTVGKHVTDAARRLEHSVKGFLTPSTIFEELGFRYVGPVDGHDIPTLVECMNNLKKIRGPIFFHCVTQKGKGYSYAENDPLKYHGVKAFDIRTGEFQGGSQKAPAKTFTDVFADTLIEAARDDSRIVAITAAMPTGTGLNKFEKVYPDRFFDVGICEQHAVTFAAGLAAQGMRPVAAIYSTFLQRAFDQYVHDVCLQKLPVVFAIDRAGAVGEDSPTQQGAFDLAFLRVIPNIEIAAPRDDLDLAAMLRYALKADAPVAVRYGRCKAPTIGAAAPRDIRRGEILRDGTDVVFLGLGPVLAHCLEAAEELALEGMSVCVADARWVKPLDTALLDQLAAMPIVTVEENTIEGGFGSAVLEYFASHGRASSVNIQMRGFPDAFIDHATREEQLEEIGLDIESLKNAARAVAPRSAVRVAK